MKDLFVYTLLLPFMFVASSAPPAQTPSSQPVVHAVLFYSPNCGHCYLVVTETIPPLFEHFGEQLQIAGVDVTQPGSQALFSSALQYYGLESSGVPFLAVGDAYLVGSVDIPEKFPGLIEQYLSQGGVDWPAIPGLAEAMAAAQPAETTPTGVATAIAASPTSDVTSIETAPTPVSVMPSPTPTPGLLITSNQSGKFEANFTRDPLGNSLAVIVLVGMILSVGGALFFFRGLSGTALTRKGSWLIPILCLIGLGIAGYLAYVETAQVEAMCGPVGDCNTVQQSKYARLFGILPIGILGLIGYMMILLTWTVGRSAGGRLTAYASIALLALTAFSLLFSIYLTFLEPFVIGATCAWCLTSAILMTALFWLSLTPAKSALSYLFHGEKYAFYRSSTERPLTGE